MRCNLPAVLMALTASVSAASAGSWSSVGAEAPALLAETRIAAGALAAAGAEIGLTIDTPFLDLAAPESDAVALEIVASAGAGAGAGFELEADLAWPWESIGPLDEIKLEDLTEIDWTDWLDALPTLHLSADAFAFAAALADFSVAAQSSHDCTPTPEPATGLIAGAAAACAWAARRRKAAA